MDSLVDKKEEKKLPADYPSKEQIEQWKKEFGDIAEAEFGKDIYIYRGMMRDDRKGLKVYQDQGYAQDQMDEEAIKLCVLYPMISDEKIIKMKAGTITFLSDEIVRLSGFIPDSEPKAL